MLLAARGRRPAPLRDDKLLADWNGLAIRALAYAGAVFERPDWAAAALSAFDTIVRLMEKDGILYHEWAGGNCGSKGFADDYAFMAEAALQLYEVTADRRFIDAARRWTEVLNTQFWDDARGGYYFTANGMESPILRPRTIHDQPSPSANSTMVSVLTKLALLTGENDFGLRAQAVLLAFAGEFTRNWIACGEFLNGFECFATGLQLVVIGRKDDARTREMVRAIWGKALPNRLLVQVESTEELAPNHPLRGKAMENGQPTVYIGQRNAFSDPITSPVSLSQTLTLPQQAAPAA
jgi:uncharacterized protein YyaL (SSP411 family)